MTLVLLAKLFVLFVLSGLLAAFLIWAEFIFWMITCCAAIVYVVGLFGCWAFDALNSPLFSPNHLRILAILLGQVAGVGAYFFFKNRR